MSERRIGDFELHELLGEGAMGKVYHAHDVNLDRPVALKLLGERTLGDPSFTDRFKREARLAAQLNHPHIATIYAFGEDKGEAYIAMEFVEGETLEDLIKREGPLDVAEVKKFGRQAAAALAVAHESGIVHRDIKSANLMVTAGGDLKVLDFGVARRTGEAQITMEGSLVGTANIMAPELIKGAEATSAADLFSLGCVLYEALAGKVAFEGEDPMAVLYKVMNEEPPPLGGKRPDVPANMLQLIEGLLNKDPEQRFGPAQAVVDALSGKETSIPVGGTMAFGGGGVGTMVLNAEDGAPIITPDDEGHASDGGEAGSRKRLWLLGGSTLAVVAVIVGYLVIGGEDLDPAMAATWTEEGEALFAARDDDPDNISRARELFERATGADPGSDRAWNNLGVLLIGQEDYDGAITALMTAADLDSTQYSVLLNLGVCYYEIRELDEANDFLIRARTIDPSMPNAHIYLGLVSEVRGTREDSTRAASSYQAAISGSPNQVDGYNALGYLLIQMAMPDSASKVLEVGISKLKGSARPSQMAPLYKNLGLARLALGHLKKAETAFLESSALLPRYADPRIGLALVRVARGERAAGIRELEELKNHPDDTVKAKASEALDQLNAGS